MLDDAIWHVCHLEAHEFRSVHRSIQIEVFYVNGHKSGPFGQDDTVEEQLDGEDISCGRSTVTREVDSIASDGESDPVRILFLGSEIGDDASVRYISPSVCWDFVFENECYCVCSVNDPF